MRRPTTDVLVALMAIFIGGAVFGQGGNLGAITLGEAPHTRDVELVRPPRAQARGPSPRRSANDIMADADRLQGDSSALSRLFKECGTPECSDYVFARWDEAQWRVAESAGSRASYREYLLLFPTGVHASDARVRIEEIDWTACRDGAGAEPCQSYTTRHPKGKYLADANGKLVEYELAAAVEQNTVKAFQEFLKKHPSHDAARERLRNLRYATAVASRSLADWIAFFDESKLPSYTVGKWTPAARAQYEQMLKNAEEEIERLLYEQAVGENALQRLREYLKRFPKGAHHQQVTIRMEPLVYEEAVKLDTEEAYQKYLAQYPEGFSSERINVLFEAAMWRRVNAAKSHSGYTQYLKRFPGGPHADEAKAQIEYMQANPAVPKIVHPPTITGQGSPPRFSWTTRFIEESGRAGYSVSGYGWVIDPKGAKWGPGGRQGNRGSLTVKPGGTAQDDHWVRGETFCGGRLEYDWSGEDTHGHPVRLREVIQLVCK